MSKQSSQKRIKLFTENVQVQEQEDEEGFIDEKDHYIYKQIQNKYIRQQEDKRQSNNDDSDNEDGYEEYKKIKHKFSLHLPEANPLLDTSKQIRFEPKQHIQCLYIKSQTMQEQLNPIHIVNNQIQPGQHKYRSQERVSESKEFSEVYLYDKFMKAGSLYKLIYSKYSDNSKSESDMNHNFAGYYINLANIFKQQGQQSTNDTNIENYLFQQLKEIHNCSSTASMYLPQSNITSQESAIPSYQKCMEEDLVVKESIKYVGQVQKEQNQQKQLVFDSRFESGNLMYAFQRNNAKYSNEYDLVLCNDINSKGYAQWFFFSIQNTTKNQTITLNLINHSKKQSLFKNGMKPAIFSVKKNQSQKQSNWERGGSHIKYYENNILKEEEYDNYYYSLQFTYTFEYDDDLVYFAMSYPYTYTQMINHINGVKDKSTVTSPKMHIKKEILCHTIANNIVPLLTITNKETDQVNQKNQQTPIHENKTKRIAILMARQHPGEAVSSFLMQGVIDFLVSDSVEANFLRSKYIFKIIPIVNPDGVIYGNFRCNLSGADLNRQWNNPNRQLHPSVYNIKQMIFKLKKQDYLIDTFIDLHGHSKKLNSFIYACKVESDQFACSIFPMILSKLNPMFHYPSCTFGLEQYKENTARGIAWNNGIQKPNIFTVETSFYGYSAKEDEFRAAHFKIEDLFNLGGDLMKSMFAYYAESIADGITKSQQLCYTLKAYTTLRKSAIIQDIIKFTSQNEQNSSQVKEDSGSDSDPLADELTVKEKINNVIGINIAKSIGLMNQINLNKGNEYNGQISQRSKCSSITDYTAKKCSILGTSSKSKQLCQRVINNDNPYQDIQIENQIIMKCNHQHHHHHHHLQLQQNKVGIVQQKIDLKDTELDDEQNLPTHELSYKQLPTSTSPKQNQKFDDVGEKYYREQAYQYKFRNLEREIQREQDLKREKEEIYKRRFRISKNTPISTPKSFNIIIDPQTTSKLQSNNIPTFLKSGSLLINSYYGIQNNEEQDSKGSLEISNDKTQGIEIGLCVRVQFFSDKQQDEWYKRQKVSHIQQHLEYWRNQYNIRNQNFFGYSQTAGFNSCDQENKNDKLQFTRNGKNSRLYSAINRLASQNFIDQNSSQTQNQNQHQRSGGGNKNKSMRNTIVSQRVNQIADEQYISYYQKSSEQQTQDSPQNINRSNSYLKKNNSGDTKKNLIQNFSKILKENAKKYNCDTKILHLSRNTISQCSTRRRSFREGATNKQEYVMKINQIHEGREIDSQPYKPIQLVHSNFDQPQIKLTIKKGNTNSIPLGNEISKNQDNLESPQHIKQNINLIQLKRNKDYHIQQSHKQ